MRTGIEPRVAIVGCGLIGHKRSRSLAGCRLVACADADRSRAEALAGATPGTVVVAEWETVVALPNVDLVIVATPHDAQPAVALAAVRAGKHVLVEKPAGRRAHELDPVKAAAQRTGVLVRVGFNHRYHAALRKAREIVDDRGIGDLMFIRARYGHGGRIGYEREWRARPEVSGGGELIDQGVHLIDLARWFLGDFSVVEGFAHTYFWNMPVEDNAFLTLRNERDQVAFLHASCTEWKNTFSFEVYGTTGKLDVSGLGGSYGTERIACYHMRPEMGPPETTIWEYPMADPSWKREMAEFVEDIRLGRLPNPGLDDAQAALRIVERIYEVSGR